MTDNMRVQFNMVIPQGEDWSNFTLINKPITKENGDVIGFITEAILDDSTQWYNCKGVIWDSFIQSQLKYDKTDFVSVVIE